MSGFKNFEEFKLKADNEYVNDLFYFFKGHVENQEWQPSTEVVFYGLNNEFEDGITFTLGEARDFLRNNYSQAKTEEVANSYAEKIKDIEAWTPEKSSPKGWVPPSQRESLSNADYDDEIGFDRDVVGDDEYEEYFNDSEESSEEIFSEEIDDSELLLVEDFDDEEIVTTDNTKDKDTPKKKEKKKVLGEELPFEDDGTNHQEEVATEKAKTEYAQAQGEMWNEVQVLFDEGEEAKTHQATISQNSQSIEEALNDTIAQMNNDLDNINHYDENGEIINPTVFTEKTLSEDINAEDAFHGNGSAGDISSFGTAFDIYASQLGSDSISSANIDSDIASLLNGVIMGMAFTGSGDQIREEIPMQEEPVVGQSIHGVHESMNTDTLGVDSGFILDEYGNLKSVAQINVEADKSNYEIGQDTRDTQYLVDVAVADRDTREGLMVPSYSGEMVEMPVHTLLQGEDFNQVYMEHFADATAVEFSAQPIPENVETIDLSFAQNGAVLGYEQDGIVYISATPNGIDEITSPQVYLHPDSAGMFEGATALTSVSFGDGVADSSFVHNMGGMFLNCENLVSVNADNLRTDNLLNIDGLFANCSKLESFSSLNWNTQNVVTAKFTFSECGSLTNDPSASWKMNALQDAEGFMSGCSSLSNIDTSGWNAKSLTVTKDMFNGCSNAETININGLQTTNVRDMSAMFKGCANIEDLNLSKLNPSSLTPSGEGHPIDDVFFGCTKLMENEEFKTQATEWAISANRAVELNSPVQVEQRYSNSQLENLRVPVSTEVVNKDGTVSQMTSYYEADKSQHFMVSATAAESLIVSTKANDNGELVVTTTKEFADNSRIVQSETVTRDGQIIKDVMAYDNTGKKMSEISADKLEELAGAKKLEINHKNEGQQVVLSIPHEGGNANSKTVIDINKDGKHTTNTVFTGKDGNQTNITPPNFTNLAQQKQNAENAASVNEKTQSRRSEKGRDGNIFGTSNSTTARKIFDSAELKQNKFLYDTGKKFEKIGADSMPILSGAKQGVKSIMTQGMSPEDMKAYNDFEKGKKISKDVVKGIFGVAIASSINFERTEFKKTLKAAELTSGIIDNKKYGISLKDLQTKSQSEIVKELKNLKDSNGKQLLSDKQIQNIAKRRQGASDAISFRDAVNSKSSVILNNTQSLTNAQLKSLNKFMNGKMSKMKPQDIINIADAYFATNKSSVLHGLKIGGLSKDAIGEILAGKNPHIKLSDLSERDLSILKLAYNTPRKSVINLKQAAKRIRGASLGAMMNVLKLTGSSLANEAASLIGSTTRAVSSTIMGATTAIKVGAIYGNLALKGVKFTGKLLSKTPPGKIIIKAGGTVKEAIGNTPLGRKIRERAQIKADKKKLRETKKETKRKAKIDKKNAAKDKLKGRVKKGVDKVAERARRTAIGMLALKAHGKAQMIANSRFGKLAGKVGRVVAAPFKMLGFVGRKLTAFVQAITKGLQKLALYAAAGLLGLITIYVLLVLIISASMSQATSTLSVNTKVMSPPTVDEEGTPLKITQEEYDEMWDDFSIILQDNYEKSEQFKQDILDSAQDLLNETPLDENGNEIIGWAGEQITEYGVVDDMEENDGLWISYEPIADDNSKDAIVLAYMILGSKDFYYKEVERYQLIEDLIELMNPTLDKATVNNTIYIDATYSDDDKEIYACRTGCEELVYYCADMDAYNDFSAAPKGKSKNYEGTKSSKDLEDCVTISEDGKTILANEESIPDVDHPVIYTDELVSHKYGDSYVSTCTGDEIVTIYYEYTYKYWSQNALTSDAKAYGEYKFYNYSSHISFPKNRCSMTDHPTAAHYHFYDTDARLIGVVEASQMKMPGYVRTAPISQSFNITLKDIGDDYGDEYLHGEYSYNIPGGVNEDSVVIGPTKEIEIKEEICQAYAQAKLNDIASQLENQLGEDFHSCRLETAYASTVPEPECSAWKVEFICEGHPVQSCPNGHTDLGVTLNQYSIEDFICFGGGALSLPYDGTYSTYIDAFLEKEPGEKELEVAHSLINQNWATLYGISAQQVSAVENGFIGEAYIYYFLTDKENGMGFENAQASAILGCIKSSSDFQINKSTSGRFGLLQWNDDALENIGKDTSVEQPTLLEQLTLLRSELNNTSNNCGFAGLNNLTEFKSCKNNLLGAKQAAKIFAENWTCGEIIDVDAAVEAAGEYFKLAIDATSEFQHPRLKDMCAYVTWALEVAQSPEHGYCQCFNYGPRTRTKADYDCSGFVASAFIYGAGLQHYNNEDMEVVNVKPTAELLKFGDLLIKHGSDTECGHIEIYIGKNTSIGAKSNDGDVGCVHMRLAEKHPTIWADHVFHQAGDQGKGWNPGDPYTYDEISASTASFNFYDGYQTYYKETNIITFSIDGTEYQAEEGMTWTKWCDSSYNTDGFFVLNNKITKSGSQFVYGCVSTFAITSGYSYSIQ